MWFWEKDRYSILTTIECESVGQRENYGGLKFYKITVP